MKQWSTFNCTGTGIAAGAQRQAVAGKRTLCALVYCVCACVCVCMCMCMCACVRMCVPACMCVCIYCSCTGTGLSPTPAPRVDAAQKQAVAGNMTLRCLP